jgi:hypothetical protein
MLRLSPAMLVMIVAAKENYADRQTVIVWERLYDSSFQKMTEHWDHRRRQDSGV